MFEEDVKSWREALSEIQPVIARLMKRINEYQEPIRLNLTRSVLVVILRYCTNSLLEAIGLMDVIRRDMYEVGEREGIIIDIKTRKVKGNPHTYVS